MHNAKNLEPVLRAAVSLALRGAKKPALFLSGGLDSAIIQAIGRIDSLYCCTWDDEDNLDAAQIASQQHEVTPVTFSRDEMISILPEIKELTGGTGTWSQCCQWFMARKAAEDGCDVVLTGECADELFGGYARYRILYWLDRMYADPHLDAYRGLVEYMVGDRTALVAKMVNRCGHVAHVLPVEPDGWTMVADAALLDRNFALPPLLANETAVIESHGLEARYPFDDPTVREFAATLPPEQLVNAVECKVCLRNAARLLGVPAAICSEKTKKGLFVPQSWRPDGAAKWSRGWFEELMSNA
jgi:asparagine synthetase B (glutamine-hydrolysing)